jgi:Sulfotransferase domain
LGLPQCHFLKQWNEYPDGWIEEQYVRHNQHVMDRVPEDQLLVFNVKEGWEPLCQFLGKPVPINKPFPHVKINTSSGLLELKETLIMVVWLWIPILVFIAATLSWACCWRKKHTPKHEKEE